jgi:hypothetical protein
MSELLLVQLPYYILTLAAFGTAGIFVIAVRKGIRGRAWLLMVVSFTALGTAFYLLAITGAPGGHMLRSTVLHPIRWLNLLAGVTWLLWLALFVKSMVSVTRHNDGA